MKGGAGRAIQALAGHSSLSTTERYMHVSPAAIDSTIRLLDQRTAVPDSGEIPETGIATRQNVNVRVAGEGASCLEEHVGTRLTGGKWHLLARATT
jgi:hypothetical protein